MNRILWIIVPCYNEEAVLPKTAPLFLKELEKLTALNLISENSKVLFVDDGSSDSTWKIIENFSKKDSRFTGIKQSRNRGHQNAVLAGLEEAKNKCDITITIDCDGQDDINAMDKMIKSYYQGNDIVYGVRSDRSSDSFFKRFTAQSYYKILNFLGADIVYNHADYRLVSSRVLKEFSDFKEVNLFLRGMFPLVGFKSACVYYERHERIAGKSHYPLKKMVNLAIDGITSLSDKPLTFISVFGSIIFSLSLIGLLVVLILSFKDLDVSTAFVILSQWLICGIELIGLGVVGKYIGKTYMEVKRRPRFIISEKTENLSNENDAREDSYAK